MLDYFKEITTVAMSSTCLFFGVCFTCRFYM